MAFAELCDHLELHLPDRRQPPAGVCAAARSSSACPPSPSPTATRSPASSAPSRSCARPPATAPPSRASLPAARLCLAEGLEITALPRNRAGWARLCRLLTLGAAAHHQGRTACCTSPTSTGLGDLAPPAAPAPRPRPAAPGCRMPAPSPARTRTPTSSRARATTARTRPRIARAARLAAGLGLPLVASAEPIMHHGSRRRLVDVLTCIRDGLRIDAIGRAAQANAERRLRSEAEMLRLFAGHEAAVHRAGEIAEELPLPPRRAALRIPEGGLGRRGPAGAARAADRQGPEVALSRTACRRRSRAQAAHELALIGRLTTRPTS